MITFPRLAVLAAGLASAASAQGAANLGIFEGSGDIGAPSHKGSVAYDAARKEYRIVGGGNNMWGVRDDFFFVWKKITGDAIMTANVKIISDGAPHRKAGLIIRKDLEPGGVYADAVVHGSGLTGLQWREKADDVTRTVHFPIEGPTRLRLERRRNVVTLFASKDGGPLVEMGSTELAPFTPMYAGIGVCAHDDKAETAVIFSDVSVEVLPPPPPAKK
uniref:3-keto-disaccharide hydrolase domain-containing protein n=1 Tax=Solibacter usitatus (strain Ellin6076) TaxID=234267 RepID=Q022J8_SOLUE